jgi:hypothetical protein
MRLESSAVARLLTALVALSSSLPGHAATAAPAVAVAAPHAGGVVLSGRGETRAAPNAPWFPIGEGATVPRRGELRSGDATLRIQLARGATVDLAPGTVVALFDHLELGLVGLGKVDAARLDLHGGELTISAPVVDSPRDRSPVLVQSDGDVFAVCLDGTLVVRALSSRRGDPLGGLAVAAYDGQARYASHGGFRALPGGEAVELRAGQAAPPSHAICVGPAWHREDGAEPTGPLAVVTDRDATAALALGFVPVDGASGYDLEIARDESFASVLSRSRAPAATSVITTPELAPGRYFSRIRARGSEGLPGYAGPTRALRVALAALPPGASAKGNTILLPSGRKLAWDDPTGLEVSVGRGGFIRADAELGLDRSAATPARVRLLGDRAVVPLALLPSAVSAAIELGPKWAVWPAIPVAITVRLVSARAGAPDTEAAQFEPKLHVTVNLTEVPVTWQREANLLRATVNRPAGMGGPWVVRVEATDAHDNPIGRGFLEVIAQK